MRGFIMMNRSVSRLTLTCSAFGRFSFAGTLMLALIFFTASHARAQSLAGLGAMTGTVTDQSNGAVANASVDVINSSLGIDRKVTTTDAGLFFAPSLPPAPGYTVSVSARGFNPSKAEGIVVHVGETVAIPIQLKVATEQETVTVSESSAPIIDLSKTEVSALINEQQLENLPINGRRADQFALLSPGVVPDATSGEVSFHGVPSGNLFLLDGVDITQQWFIQNAGGEALLSNISMDAVQEFRTELLGYSAEFGRGSGGVVNTLTKSGTNQLHGTGFWFFRNRTLNAIDLYSKLLENGVSTPYNPPEYRHQFGGAVGGPIIKDKLFFFSSYEGTIRNFPLVSDMFSEGAYINTTTGQLNPEIIGATPQQDVVGSCNDVADPRAGAPAALAPGFVATAAQCAAVQTFINRLSIPSVIARNLHQNAGFARFDYRPNEKSSYSANFDLVNYSALHDGTSLASTTDGTGASGENYDINTHVRNAHIANTYVISNSMVNELRLGWNADRRFQGLPADLAPPDNIRSSLTIAGISTFGVSLNQLPNIQPTEDRYDVSDNFSQSKGKHELKYGVDLAYLRSVENAVFSGPGGFTYTSFTNFAFDLTPNPATDPVTASQGPGIHYSTFAQAVGHPLTRITIRDYDFFAQDLYQVTPALSLNLGLRYDYSTFTQPPPPTYAATNPNVGKINQPKADFSPRVGFSYAMNGNRTLVRGSYGIFYNRLPGATITRLQQLGGTVRKSFTLSTNTASQFAVALPFPERFTSLSQVNGVLSPSSINSGFAIPTLATPYVQEWSLGVERSIGKNMSVNLAYAGSRGLKFLQRSDLNAGPPTGVDTFNVVNTSGTVTGTYSTPVYYNAANGNTTYNPLYSKILQIDNAGRLWYDGLIAEFHQRENKYVQSNIAYTYSHSEDLGQGTFSSNYYFSDQGDTFYNGAFKIGNKSGYAYEKGRSLEDQRHRIVMNAVFHTPDMKGSTFKEESLNGWQLAPIFTYATPQYVDSTLTVSTADPRLYVATPTLSGIGAEAPGGTRAPFLPTANLPLGHTVQLDGRLTKTFPIHEAQSIELSFEAINALNHIRNTGVVQLSYKSTWSAATETGTLTQQPVGGTTGLGAGSASAGFPDGTNARRAQASLRFTF
jgi:outer membrane receptor protein involved in Fe transport